MAYKSFDTDNAHYFLVYAKHVLGATDEKILSKDSMRNLDGIVLEMSAEPTAATYNSKPMPLDGKNMYGNSQYGAVIDRVKELRQEGVTLPIYVGDCDIRMDALGHLGGIVPPMAVNFVNQNLRMELAKRLSKLAPKQYQQLVATLGTAVLMSPELIGAGFSLVKGEIPNGLDDVVAASGLLLPTPIAEFRNAIIASKLEDYLAPKLLDETGEKPTFAIIYGALHAGIRHNLQSKKRRDAIMGMYRKMNYLWFNKPSMDNLVELTLDDQMEWQVKEHKTGVK